MASEIPMQPAPDSTVAAVVAPPERADEIFLEGPRSRFAEFCTLLRVMRDFLRGYRALHFVGPCVTVFGSARIKPDDPHYELALKMGAAIARLGFTVMTGGVGTLDELFEALTLIQNGKIKHFPVVIMGTDYWKQLIAFIEQMAERGKISPSDLNLIYATDSVEEAIAHIRAKAIERFGLKRAEHMRRHFPWLGERGFPSKGPEIC